MPERSRIVLYQILQCNVPKEPPAEHAVTCAAQHLPGICTQNLQYKKSHRRNRDAVCLRKGNRAFLVDEEGLIRLEHKR